MTFKLWFELEDIFYKLIVALHLHTLTLIDLCLLNLNLLKKCKIEVLKHLIIVQISWHIMIGGMVNVIIIKVESFFFNSATSKL